jgi:hypothetical protein
MQYGIITKQTAAENLISTYGRIEIDGQIIINELDIMRCNVRGTTLEERADRLGTRLYSYQEISELKNK